MPEMFRLDPAHVGRRVVVRYALPDGRATDVRGTLRTLDGATVVVTADGDHRDRTSIARADVIAAKPIPPARITPRSGLLALERVADLGWPGLERVRLGDWVLRASAGFTGRANSVLALGDPGCDLDDALTVVDTFYAERGLQTRVHVPYPLDAADPAPGLDAQLAARGFGASAATLFMAARLGTPIAGRSAVAEGRSLSFAAEPDDAFLRLYKYHGQDVPEVGKQVMTAAPLQAFAAVTQQVSGGPETVAVGRVAVAENWAGITAMQVADDHLREGLGSFVLDALLDWGRRHGASYAYLQVLSDNHHAIGLYRTRGFEPSHLYHYRAR